VSELEDVINVVTKRAETYYPELGSDVRVQRRRVLRRLNCQLVVLRVSGAGQTRDLVVKIPRLDCVTDACDDRPRLAALMPPPLRCRQEYKALSLMQRRLNQIGDPALRCVRVFDLLTTDSLVMERVATGTLRQFLWQASRPREWTMPANMFDVLGRVGRWLKIFHSLELPAETRHSTIQAHVETNHAFAAFLEDRWGRGVGFTAWAKRHAAIAQTYLPTQLPLGLSHGDFAPRNMFVDGQGGVIGFDALGRWRAPCYEDIADFLVNLKCSGAQAVSLEFLFRDATLMRLEKAFLQGYFEGEAERNTLIVKLFEVQSLLAKWVSLAAQPSRARKRGVATLQARLYGRHINKLLTELERNDDDNS
jgi:hypothetical protein